MATNGQQEHEGSWQPVMLSSALIYTPAHTATMDVARLASSPKDPRRPPSLPSNWFGLVDGRFVSGGYGP